MKNIIIILFLVFNSSLIAQENSKMDKNQNKTEAEWKEILTPQQYYILREKGTDRPGDSGYTNLFEKGTYHCAACDTQLFESNTKYESHCGWPSFDDAIKGSVDFTSDTTLGMTRTEITCTNCGGHLGHIFDDGPKETTGKRYCVNTTSIRFEKSE
ncbi:MAG: peptide-methionine (R)-S-oxide reductase MsrB, partial [Flavobacteriaceae bacterium]|nr:peptide-methionine (R)-S-oxide reductase MsrB [Flavobacteriaceae bacterium]